MSKKVFILAHDQARNLTAKFALEYAPLGTQVVFSDPTRNLDQNARFHAICNALARSSLEWAGKTRTAEEWKLLLVSGHTQATNGEVEFVPGLEGEFVNLREKTSTMSKKRCASLIEYTQAFCDGHSVDYSVEYEKLRARGLIS